MSYLAFGISFFFFSFLFPLRLSFFLVSRFWSLLLQLPTFLHDDPSDEHKIYYVRSTTGGILWLAISGAGLDILNMRADLQVYTCKGTSQRLE